MYYENLRWTEQYTEGIEGVQEELCGHFIGCPGTIDYNKIIYT